MNTAACSLAISFGSVMVVPCFPFSYCLGGQMFFPDILLILSHTCFIGVSADSFDTYSAHDWRFFWLKSRVVRVVQGPGYRKMTIRLKDAAVCGDRVTPNMATYAFLICHNGCK